MYEPIRMVAAASGKVELWLYGPVVSSRWAEEGDVCMQNVKRLIDSAGPVSEILVHLSSLGGDAFEGFQIYQFLAQHTAQVTIQIDMMAASVASIIACAGDTIRIAETGLMLVHDPATIVWGTADDLRAVASDLDKLRDAAVAAYMGCTKRRGKQAKPEALAALMKEDKYLSSQEAFEWGFVDEVVPAKGNEKESPAQSREGNARMLREASLRMVSHRAFFASTLESVTRDDQGRVNGVANSNSQRPLAATNPGAAQETADMQLFATLAGILGLVTGATEEQVIAQVTQLKSGDTERTPLLTELEELTGQKGAPALAVVRAFKASHDKLPGVEAALKSERDAKEADARSRDDTEKAALIKNAVDQTGQITEAEKSFWEAKSLSDVKAYLAVAHSKIPGAGAGQRIEAGARATLTAEDRKVAAKMGISLEKFQAMRAEEQASNASSTDEEE
jgi:ATP-dependent protease ClpP protease subunit